MNYESLDHQVQQAVSAFMSQYSQTQQVVLRQSLITELERLEHHLIQLRSCDSFSDLKHQFIGMTSYLALRDIFNIVNLTSLDIFKVQVHLLLKVVKEETHGQ